MTTKIRRLVKQSRSVLYHASLSHDQARKLEKYFYRTPKSGNGKSRSALPATEIDLRCYLRSLFRLFPVVAVIDSSSIFDAEIFDITAFSFAVKFKTFNPQEGLLTTIIVHAGYS